METKRMVVIPEEELQKIQKEYPYNTTLKFVLEDLITKYSREVNNSKVEGRLYSSPDIFELAKQEMIKTYDKAYRYNESFNSDTLNGVRFGIFTLLNAIAQYEKYFIAQSTEDEK